MRMWCVMACSLTLTASSHPSAGHWTAPDVMCAIFVKGLGQWGKLPPPSPEGCHQCPLPSHPPCPLLLKCTCLSPLAPNTFRAACIWALSASARVLSPCCFWRFSSISWLTNSFCSWSTCNLLVVIWEYRVPRGSRCTETYATKENNIWKWNT